MTELEHLSLAHTRVTDKTLVYLENMKYLQSVNLDHTRVTDEGLVHLHGLPKLNSVSLEGTQVTEAGLAALKAATPSLSAVDQRRARLQKNAEEFRKQREKQVMPSVDSAPDGQ
jgi:ABC-type transport system involved in cytochrome c biogenesis ATPase subunit